MAEWKIPLSDRLTVIRVFDMCLFPEKSKVDENPSVDCIFGNIFTNKQTWKNMNVRKIKMQTNTNVRKLS